MDCEVISAGTSSLLSAASVLNGKAVIIGTLNTQYYEASSETEWTKSSSNTTTRQLNSVYSVENNIWAAGNNLTLLRSTDNGQNFESIPPAVSTLYISDCGIAGETHKEKQDGSEQDCFYCSLLVNEFIGIWFCSFHFKMIWFIFKHHFFC